MLDHEKDIGLILLDINLPVVNGATLNEVIQQVYKPGPKVMITSVYPLEDQKKLVENADDYYDKSEGTNVLLSKIRQLLYTSEGVFHDRESYGSG